MTLQMVQCIDNFFSRHVLSFLLAIMPRNHFFSVDNQANLLLSHLLSAIKPPINHLTIQMWYDRIHAYLQFIRMKEGMTNNPRNILRFVRCQHIDNPAELTTEELQDGLQFAQIRKSELRKQVKG
jgi:hypothetical protein